jgi:hypothetical protein
MLLVKSRVGLTENSSNSTNNKYAYLVQNVVFLLRKNIAGSQALSIFRSAVTTTLKKQLDVQMEKQDKREETQQTHAHIIKHRSIMTVKMRTSTTLAMTSTAK